MRLVAVMLAALSALCLSACSATLVRHAEVWRAANDTVAGIGDVINREKKADYDDAGGLNIPNDKRTALDAHWDPIVDGYNDVGVVLDVYQDAITRAQVDGDTSPLAPLARRLLQAWAKVDVITSAIGVPLPPPPAALDKLGAK